MKLALAQLNYHIGNFDANERKIIEAIQNATKQGAELVVFAELAISGYPPRDFLAFDDFVAHCEIAIERIAQHCTDIAAIVGGPSINKEGSGKSLFNTAYFLEDGQVRSKHFKQLLPTYDVFDEYRYFESGHSVECVHYKGKKIALTICEDIWNTDHQRLYRHTPMEQLVKENPDFIINIAASPFSQEQESKRKFVFKWNANKFGRPIYYVNHVGAQTELIFDGNSLAMNKYGEVTLQLSAFEEELVLLDTTEQKAIEQTVVSKYSKIEKALILGISDYFRKLNFKKATLGLSGGIDSALTLVLAVKALGAENVIPILMPSQFSSEHSVQDAVDLCENLGCNSHLIHISKIYKAFEQKLEPLFANTDFGIAEENIQSRIRGTLLMGHTNKFGTILLNTSNKSELAVGYGTLYGDMSGGLSVLGDVYKTEVFELSKFINRENEIIPNNTLVKEPSAELKPDQKDSDSLPDYEILDAILIEYIEHQLSPQAIIKKGFDKTLVNRILKMVNINEYKRHQAPPILRISEKAFGMGRRMPIVGKYLA
ncbi:MAG: NAD+ synthase [Verrucomicrobia bacterium]|nr:NAD+ synthase [Verrucomicrobiota bacterium]|tara:strand:+ start:457 stop:2082 length:1626 start_codon:yes stop_codon:yes gene_type:complete